MSTQRAENEQSREQVESTEGHPAQGSSGLLKSGVDAREAARLSVEVRREKAAQRERQRQQDALTVRQRLAVALSSRLTVADWEHVIERMVDKGDTAALARLADQAFGRPSEQDADQPEDDLLARLTRDQRAIIREWLLSREASERGHALPH